MSAKTYTMHTSEFADLMAESLNAMQHQRFGLKTVGFINRTSASLNATKSFLQYPSDDVEGLVVSADKSFFIDKAFAEDRYPDPMLFIEFYDGKRISIDAINYTSRYTNTHDELVNAIVAKLLYQMGGNGVTWGGFFDLKLEDEPYIHYYAANIAKLLVAFSLVPAAVNNRFAEFLREQQPKESNTYFLLKIETDSDRSHHDAPLVINLQYPKIATHDIANISNYRFAVNSFDEGRSSNVLTMPVGSTISEAIQSFVDRDFVDYHRMVSTIPQMSMRHYANLTAKRVHKILGVFQDKDSYPSGTKLIPVFDVIERHMIRRDDMPHAKTQYLPYSVLDELMTVNYDDIQQRYVMGNTAMQQFEGVMPQSSEIRSFNVARWYIRNEIDEYISTQCSCGSTSPTSIEGFYDNVYSYYYHVESTQIPISNQNQVLRYIRFVYGDGSVAPENKEFVDVLDDVYEYVKDHIDWEGPYDGYYCDECGLGEDYEEDRYNGIDEGYLSSTAVETLNKKFEGTNKTVQYYDGFYVLKHTDEEDQSGYASTMRDVHDYFVNPYDYNPGITYIETKEEKEADSKNDKLYLGLEWEMDMGGQDHTSSVLINSALSKNKLYSWAMSDGSLEDGIEFATMPATLDAHMKMFDYDTACDVASYLGYRGHDVSTAGIHVHISRSYFGKDKKIQMYRGALLALVLEKNWDDFVKFSRRRYNRIDQWAKKKDYLDALPSNPTADDYQKAFNDKYGYDKYVALNTSKSATFELRIFRSTLKASTIKATLQLVHNLAKWVKDHDLAAAQDVKFEDIVNYVSHKELNEYWQVAKEREVRD